MSVLLQKFAHGTLANNTAKKIVNPLFTTSESVHDLIAAELATEQMSSAELTAVIEIIIDKHPQQASDYRAGKDKLFGFFVGLIMKETKGKADPVMISSMLKETLGLLH